MPRRPAPRPVRAAARPAHPVRRLAPALAAAALDLIAAALAGSSAAEGGLPVAAVAALHLAAALVASGARPLADGRRWLCASVVLTVPLFGAAIACALVLTRGRGSLVPEPMPEPAGASGWMKTAARAAMDAVPTCDALVTGDEEERGAALVRLTRRADAEGITVLRRAAAGNDPDLSLLAALALDEIDERDGGAGACGPACARQHVAG